MPTSLVARISRMSMEPLAVRDLPSMSLQQVAAFVCVAQQGSFREAAKALYLDASTVSKLVRRLEVELGRQLFRRSTRRVVLTAYGATVLGLAERLLSDAQALASMAATA